MNNYINGMDRLLMQHRAKINMLESQLAKYKEAIQFLLEDNKNRRENEETAIKEREKVINQFRCVICFQKPKSILFDPCMHFSTCQSCSDRLQHCPICRGEFESRLLVFGE